MNCRKEALSICGHAHSNKMVNDLNTSIYNTLMIYMYGFNFD